MSTAFFITFHQGLDTIVIVAIIAAFLLRVGARSQIGRVVFGTIIGLYASLGVAILLLAASATWSSFSLAGVLGVVHALAGGFLLLMLGWMCEQRRIIRAGDYAAARYPHASIVIGVVLLAMLHQGVELAMHVYGVMSSNDVLASVPSIAGMAAAMLVGVLIFYALRALPLRWFLSGGTFFVGLVAAGMWVMAVGHWQDAGIIPFVSPLWDTSHLISVTSWLGHMLQTFFGYTPHPTGPMLIVYGLVLNVVAMYECRARGVRVRLPVLTRTRRAVKPSA